MRLKLKPGDLEMLSMIPFGISPEVIIAIAMDAEELDRRITILIWVEVAVALLGVFAVCVQQWLGAVLAVLTLIPFTYFQLRYHNLLETYRGFLLVMAGLPPNKE
jgi:hypothetical protein